MCSRGLGLDGNMEHVNVSLVISVSIGKAMHTPLLASVSTTPVAT